MSTDWKDLANLASHVKDHMDSLNKKVSSNPYYVCIHSACIEWSGIIIDTPGLVANPLAMSPEAREAEAEVQRGVERILEERLKSVDLKHSIVLCVESLKFRVTSFFRFILMWFSPMKATSTTSI